ncbi:DNA methyltransferase 1-associated protein 1 [Porphyridium purpureum]|uniref:DNA methyltransferase 1-associated protein 1 n=1 Tax=Porphyridium purpureum TaxID=35688 RepID=A0A5J4YX10_PORPP|nr:DNA methyltransferase 1-associated protein 1 [Porphyridium purpureum]|eukprot:POR1589..scf209_3
MAAREGNKERDVFTGPSDGMLSSGNGLAPLGVAARSAQAPQPTSASPAPSGSPTRQHSAAMPSPSPRARHSRTGGVQRELSILQADRLAHAASSPVCLMPVYKPVFKERRPTAAARIRYERRKVPVLGRDDGLELEAWVQVPDTSGTEHPGASPAAQLQQPFAPFVRFSKPARILTYTEAEYALHLDALQPSPVAFPFPGTRPAADCASAATDGSTGHANPKSAAVAGSASVGVPVVDAKAGAAESEAAALPSPSRAKQNSYVFEPWTKADTDVLFELCKRFDLRFPVIHDRWPDHCTKRTLDELRDRYYSVARKIFEVRSKLTGHAAAKAQPSGALLRHAQAILQNPFDIEYELIRKDQLEVQFRRDKMELMKEEQLISRARAIDAQRKRALKEKQRLQKLLQISNEEMEAVSVASVKHRIGSGVVQSLLTNAAAADGSPRMSCGVRLSLDTASGLPSKAFPHRKMVAGVFARSSLTFTPVTQAIKVAKKVDIHLNQLNIPVRPMATGPIMDEFDALRMELVAFLELHRIVSKKEEDVHFMRIRKAKQDGIPPPPPPRGINLSHKKRKTEEVYDFHENNDELDAGQRAQQGLGTSQPPTEPGPSRVLDEPEIPMSDHVVFLARLCLYAYWAAANGVYVVRLLTRSPHLARLLSYGKLQDTRTRRDAAASHWLSPARPLIDKRVAWLSFYVCALLLNSIQIVMWATAPSLILVSESVQHWTQWVPAIMFQLQLVRRCLECLFVHRMSRDRVSAVHFLGGLKKQSFMFIRLACKLTCGILTFWAGSWLQNACHRELARMRRHQERESKEKVYYAPQSALFRYVRTPHYLAEMLVYASLLLTSNGSGTCSLLAFSFVVLNLSCTAVETERCSPVGRIARPEPQKSIPHVRPSSGQAVAAVAAAAVVVVVAAAVAAMETLMQQ